MKISHNIFLQPLYMQKLFCLIYLTHSGFWPKALIFLTNLETKEYIPQRTLMLPSIAKLDLIECAFLYIYIFTLGHLLLRHN